MTRGAIFVMVLTYNTNDYKGAIMTNRYLAVEPAGFLKVPLARIQPVLAKEGNPNVDIAKLKKLIGGYGVLNDTIAIRSPEHWASVISSTGDDVDAILPVSITAYPTEVWNSHPGPLVDRGLPLLFWPIIKYDEMDFWRWSARDFLTAIGVDVHLIRNNREGLDTLKALAMKRFLGKSRIVVFGEQNFPWNAPVAGHLVTDKIGTQIVVKPIAEIRNRYSRFSDAEVNAVWEKRRKRYIVKNVREQELHQAVRIYLSIKSIIEEEKALGFGVNCFGELVIKGGRDVPCLAQVLMREDGYIASCDGDYLAMMSMVLSTYYLSQTSIMSNMYPVSFVGALTDHFGDPLAPGKKYPKPQWKNMARLGHCGFIGVVSPEIAPSGKVALRDWGGTYEIKRDGRGCGIDGEMKPGKATAIQYKFDGKTVLLAACEVCETTRHKGMPHCESTALLKFKNLEGFVENISREHSVIVYGDHIAELQTLCRILGLNCMTF